MHRNATTTEPRRSTHHGRRRRSSRVGGLLLFFSVAVLLQGSLLRAPLLVSAQNCAEKGEKAKECGTDGNHPKKCCGDLVCRADGANSKCVNKSRNEQQRGLKKRIGNLDSCAGWGDKAVSCGEENVERSHVCCGGYKCEKGSISCTHATKKTKPLDPIEAKFQQKPIKVNKNIEVLGTTFNSAQDRDSLTIGVPKKAEKGCFLLMLVGGSASGNAIPGDPSGKGWKQIYVFGKKDLNLRALYKWHNDGDESYRITGGKNTLTTLVAIEGVDKKDPVVDADGVRNSAPGKDGRATAPRVKGERGGCTFGVFLYDDPQVCQVVSDPKSFHVLATTESKQGADGMGTFVASTDGTGKTDIIEVAGSPAKGGGNDCAMTVTLRG